MQFITKGDSMGLDTSNHLWIAQRFGASGCLSIDHFTQICKRAKYCRSISYVNPMVLLWFYGVINPSAHHILKPFLWEFGKRAIRMYYGTLKSNKCLRSVVMLMEPTLRSHVSAQPPATTVVQLGVRTPCQSKQECSHASWWPPADPLALGRQRTPLCL